MKNKAEVSKKKYKLIFFLFLSFFALMISYIEISYLMYTKPIFPLAKPAIQKSDVMDEVEAEMARVTDQEWLFWTSDSYIDYRWRSDKRFINLYFASGTAAMQAKIFWGIDDVFEEKYEGIEIVEGVYNFIKIPKQEYNCVRIYLCNPVEGYEGDEGVEWTSYISIKEICVADGCLDWVRLYGGSLIVWLINIFFIWAILYGKKSWCRKTDLKCKRTLAFCTIWVLFLFVKCYLKYNGLAYFADAGFYYSIGDTFLADGKFSFKNYLIGQEMGAFRGYFLPFFFFLLKLPGRVISKIGPDISYDICSTAFSAAFFAWGGEYFFHKITGKRLDFLRILGAPCLFCVFARGLIAYPLSDFYSVAFAMLAIYFIQQAIECRGNKKIIYSIFAGGSLYATYNIRSSWILFCIFALGITIYQCRQIRDIIRIIAGMGIGVLVMGYPQLIVNENICGVRSIAIQNQNYVDGESLTLVQLKSGAYAYRAESDLTAGNVLCCKIWTSKDADEIRTELDSVQSIPQYVIFMIKHPFLLLKNIVVHFYEAANMRFPNIINKHIESVNSLQNMYSGCFWVCFTILFWQKRRSIFLKKNVLSIGWGLSLMMPAFAQIMGRFEQRFAVSIYIICFMFISYTGSCKEIRAIKW